MEGRDAPLWRCPRLPSPEARAPPRRADWVVRIQVPVRESGAGSSSSAAARRGAPATPLAPGRAVGAVAVGAQPGTAPARSRAARPGPAAWPARRARHPLAPGPRCPVEAVGVDPRRAGATGATPRLCPIRAPVPTGVLDGGHRRSVIADQDRVGVGGPPGSTRARAALAPVAHDAVRASRLNVGTGGPVDAAARGAVATPVPFAPSVSARARAVRWRSDPAAQKGGRRISFTPRPAPLPSRNGAMTPFPGRAGAAAHPKDTRRPPFSAPPTPRAATAGPPEASTAPGPSSTPARTATAGVASRSPRGNHRTAPDPARISRIRADAESAVPAGGRRRGVLAGECQPEVGRTGPGASRPDPGPRSIPIRSGRSAGPAHTPRGRRPRVRSGRSARTSHNPRERLPGVRSRGLPGDLAGQATISRRAGRAVRAVRLPRGSSPTARTRGAAGSVPPALVREAGAEDGVGEVIPIRCRPRP